MFAGTVTVTRRASADGEAVLPILSATTLATAVDFTSWASVSRLTAPGVRLSTRVVSAAVASTLTSAVET